MGSSKVKTMLFWATNIFDLIARKIIGRNKKKVSKIISHNQS
jgi:hypothetical protein